MQEFHGDLLIGGERLKRVPCELEAETPQPNSLDWALAGHLHLPPEAAELLETDRPYRLLLEDGRAGQVIVSRIALDGQPHRLVDFEPKPR
jgi:hypothetical protein